MQGNGPEGANVFNSFGNYVVPKSFPGAPTWAQVLAVGNHTGANDAYVDQSIILPTAAVSTTSVISVTNVPGAPTSTLVRPGSLAWDTVGLNLYVYDGTAWQPLTSGGVGNLAAVLAVGNVSGANSIVMTAPQQLIFNGGVRIADGAAGTGATAGTAINVGNISTIASGVNSIAIGNDSTTSTGARGIVIGNLSALSSGQSNIAVGDQAQVTSTGTDNIAIGTTPLVSGNALAVANIALGLGAQTTGNTANKIAVGRGAVASDTGAIAIGWLAAASATSAVAVGPSAVTAAKDSIAIGGLTDISAGGTSAVVIGISSTSDGANSVIVGKNNQILSNTDAILIGSDNRSGTSTQSAILIGTNLAPPDLTVDIIAIGGVVINNPADRSVYIGNGLTVTADDTVVVATDSVVTGLKNVSIGYDTSINGNFNVNMGTILDTDGQRCVNIGLQNSVGTAVEFCVDIGYNNSVGSSIEHVVVLGDNNTITGITHNVVCIGDNNTCNDLENSVVLGNNINATTNNTVYFQTSLISLGTANPELLYNSATGIVGPSISSRRFKRDIRPIENPERVLDVQVKTFKSALGSCGCPAHVDDPKADCDTRGVGAIAEEVLEVVPEVVLFQRMKDGKVVPQSLDYKGLTMMLIPVVAKLNERVAELERLQYELF